MYVCRRQWIAPGSLELWLPVETWTRRQLIKWYIFLAWKCMPQQEEALLMISWRALLLWWYTNYYYCWEYVPKGGGVEFILALPFRMSSVWNGYLNFVHMSRDFLTDGRLNVSSSDISCSCFSMMGPDPVFIQW
jgi:hypothetical protein